MRRTLLALTLFTAAATFVGCGGSSSPTATVPAPTAGPDPTPPTPAPPKSEPEQKALPDQPPLPVANAKEGENLLADCRRYLGEAGKQRQAITAKDLKPGVDTTYGIYNELLRNLSNAGALASLMQAVHPAQEVRDAARTCETEVSKFLTELSLDKNVYNAIVAVDVKAADPNTKRLHEVTVRDYKRAGVALADAKRDRIRAIDEEVTQLGQQISKNIAEDTRHIEVTDPKRLAGMPADWVAAHKADAKGVIKITTDYPDYIPFMTYADDDELRKQLYVKFRSRGDAENEALFTKLFTLRAEKAKLLGFKDWADYQSDDKMLRGGKNAAAFIERIAALARPRMKADYAELVAYAKTLDPKATAVTDWQKSYIETKVKKEKYAVDSTEVRKYFVYDKVLTGLLDITSKIYDIQYKHLPDAKTWHPDVAVYDVMRGSEKLGTIYLDMHPRADKYKHAAQFTIKDGMLGAQLPEGALVCNFPNPKTSNGPALMEHGDVVTMFHEFGHLMHHVLGGHQKWIRQAGVATEHDFVEAPSQMFEEWGWNHDTLATFAKHYQTGEAIPKDLVAKMRKAEKFGLGLQVGQQMFYAAMSLQFHQADPKKLDQLALMKKLQARYTPFAYVEGTKFHTSFGHLVGYSSMYYTYMWSLVIAKDLLTPFEKAGLMNTAVTYKYRDKILAAGGTKPAAELVKDFLGRKYDFRAYEKYLKN